MNLTETHLSESILDVESEISLFTQNRCDRVNRKGGGSVDYIADFLAVNWSKTYSNCFVDMAGEFIPKLAFLNVTVYRPPGCPSYKFTEAMDVLQSWIEEIETKNKGVTLTIWINGDFNFPWIILRFRAKGSPIMDRAAHRDLDAAAHPFLLPVGSVTSRTAS